MASATTSSSFYQQNGMSGLADQQGINGPSSGVIVNGMMDHSMLMPNPMMSDDLNSWSSPSRRRLPKLPPDGSPFHAGGAIIGGVNSQQ